MCFVPVDCAFADIAEDITVPERNAGLAMTEHAWHEQLLQLEPNGFLQFNAFIFRIARLLRILQLEDFAPWLSEVGGGLLVCKVLPQSHL